jgi:hypothetical protein
MRPQHPALSCLPSALHMNARIGGHSQYSLYYCVAVCGHKQSSWPAPTTIISLTSRYVFCCDSGLIKPSFASHGADSVWGYKSLLTLIFSAAHNRHKARIMSKVELSDALSQEEHNVIAHMHRKNLIKDVTREEATAWSFYTIPLESAARK